MLAAALRETPMPLQLDTVFCGSVEALVCLQERQSELAGFYVSPIQTAGSVAHVTLRKWLRPATVRLVRLAWREQGLIVAPDLARDIRELRDLGFEDPIYIHGALQRLCDLYVELGVDLGDLRPATGMAKAELQGRIVLCPPGALNDRWSRRLPDPITAMASGWMRVRQRARQRLVELPLILSDHAD